MVVNDSLVAGGWSETIVGRLTGLFTGETEPMDLYRAFMGGGPVGNPEAFRERPGEAAGGAGFGGMGQLMTIVDLILPGGGMGALIRMFEGSASEPAPLAEPGTYTLTLTVGDRTFSQPLAVERVGSYVGKSAPFESSGRR